MPIAIYFTPYPCILYYKKCVRISLFSVLFVLKNGVVSFVFLNLTFAWVVCKNGYKIATIETSKTSSYQGIVGSKCTSDLLNKIFTDIFFLQLFKYLCRTIWKFTSYNSLEGRTLAIIVHTAFLLDIARQTFSGSNFHKNLIRVRYETSLEGESKMWRDA